MPSLVLTSSDFLELYLSGAITTSNPTFVASWIDKDTDTPGGFSGTLNGTSHVVVVPSPVSGTRLVLRLDVFNGDTAPVTISLSKVSSSVSCKFASHYLSAGQSGCLLEVEANYATEAQGAKADTALQPTGNGSQLTGLTKGQVGLGNVDNTSDANKPVSTAQAAAIALKQDASTALALGETSGTAYRGDRGKIAYDFSQATTGITAGSYGGASSVATFTVDAQGRQTAAASVSIQIAQSQVTDLGTALSAKAPVDNPTFTTGITTPAANITGLTASRALVSDASKNVTASAVTSTELGYVHGVTSAIQTQIDDKATAIAAETIRAQAAEAARADEETGTWTPTLWSQGHDVTGVTYSSGPGRYTRHGHVVTVWADIQMTSSGTGGDTGVVRLSGLPFAAASNADAAWRYVAVVYDRNLTSAWVTGLGPASLILLCQPGSTVPAFMSSHAGGYLTWDFLTSTTRLAFVFTYQIN